MASNVNLPAILDSLNGTGLDLSGGHDIRVIIVQNTTTCDTEDNIATVDAYTTLGEDVAAGRKTLASEAIAIDAGNNRVEFDFEDLVFTALANAAAPHHGILIYRFITDDTDGVPICFIQFSADQSPGGSDFTVAIDAQGAIHFKQGA